MTDYKAYEIQNDFGVIDSGVRVGRSHKGFTILNPDGDAVGGAALSYIMRGYDDDVSHLVFWSSSEVDADASDYGGVGPVTNIVIHKVLGA